MKQRLLSLLLCLFLVTGLFPTVSLASTDWPGDISIESDAGIVMDARSGAVLYGKNIHSTFSPASITKVLTAIIVLEQCSMDEIVTFSRNAVYNVEPNSTSAGYDTGDQATVKDCLYALMLKSANEAANALAEHVAGTTEEFAVLMNEKAASLGCEDSNFTNPSGLNDDNHYVSAYDMALITRNAFEDERFAEIVSTTFYKLPPNKLNPDGQGISPGNKMVKKNWPDQYRPDVIGGKTGFTSIALNTLVNCAEQGDTRLVTVILHSKGTQYNDTKKLLDFGFRNFQSIRITDYDDTYTSLSENFMISGLPTSEKSILTVDPASWLILPKSSDFSETTAELDFELPADAPSNAMGRIRYTLNERFVGYAYLVLSDITAKTTTSLPDALLEVKPTIFSSGASEMEEHPDSLESEEGIGPAARSIPLESNQDETVEAEPDNKLTAISFKLPSFFWKILIFLVLIVGIGGGSVYLLKRRIKREEQERAERRKRRLERLKESGISEADFNIMVQKRRSHEPSDFSAEDEITPPHHSGASRWDEDE